MAACQQPGFLFRRRRKTDIAMWVAVGALAAWIGFAFLKLNAARGLAISVMIGVAGAVFGGYLIGPLLASTVHPGDFNPLSLFIAFASAAGCVIISNMVYRRFGV